MTVKFKPIPPMPTHYETVNEEMEMIGVVHHKLAYDGKSGHVVFITSPAGLPDGAEVYIKRKTREINY